MKRIEIKINRTGEFLETGGAVSLELIELSKIIKRDPSATIFYLIGDQYKLMISINAPDVILHHTGLTFKEVESIPQEHTLKLDGQNGIICCRGVHDLLTSLERCSKETHIAISSAVTKKTIRKDLVEAFDKKIDEYKNIITFTSNKGDYLM